VHATTERIFSPISITQLCSYGNVKSVLPPVSAKTENPLAELLEVGMEMGRERGREGETFGNRDSFYFVRSRTTEYGRVKFERHLPPFPVGFGRARHHRLTAQLTKDNKFKSPESNYSTWE
jgi:hypothetical protein